MAVDILVQTATDLGDENFHSERERNLRYRLAIKRSESSESASAGEEPAVRKRARPSAEAKKGSGLVTAQSPRAAQSDPWAAHSQHRLR